MNTNELLAAGPVVAGAHGQHIGIGLIVLALLVLGHILFGGQGALGFPPMPTWAMISVILGWIVGWSSIGAWRMMTRDA